MLHIKPIQPAAANKTVNAIYTEIRQVLHTDIIPLIFQYMANYEKYLMFVWERMKANIDSSGFQEQSDAMGMFAAQTIVEVFQPSSHLLEFMKQIHPRERQEIAETVKRLKQLNIILFLLTLDLREGMKSIFIGTQRLTKDATSGQDINQFIKEEMGLSLQNQSKELQEASKMLAPLFGANAVVVSHYPDFFGHIALEMEQLRQSPVYLEKRVELEHIGLAALSSFVQPVSCSYDEFLMLTAGTTYVTEILYLLTDMFPSQFPHLVLTTSLMQYSLHLKENS